MIPACWVCRERGGACPRGADDHRACDTCAQQVCVICSVPACCRRLLWARTLTVFDLGTRSQRMMPETGEWRARQIDPEAPYPSTHVCVACAVCSDCGMVPGSATGDWMQITGVHQFTGKMCIISLCISCQKRRDRPCWRCGDPVGPQPRACSHTEGAPRLCGGCVADRRGYRRCWMCPRGTSPAACVSIHGEPVCCRHRWKACRLCRRLHVRGDAPCSGCLWRVVVLQRAIKDWLYAGPMIGILSRRWTARLSSAADQIHGRLSAACDT